MLRNLLVLLLGGAIAAMAPAEPTILTRTRRALGEVQANLPAVTAAAEATADALAAGGKFWAGGHPALISEFSGRAGGIMMLKPLRMDQVAKGDAVLYAPGALEKAAELNALQAAGAVLVCIGGEGPDGAMNLAVSADLAGLSPTLAGAATGWVYVAEAIAALTRRGKMPVIYESIGMYGGYRRIAEYDAKGIYWHEKHAVPEIPPGTLGTIYCTAVSGYLDRVEREMEPRLVTLGDWVAEARAANKRTIMYNMGHLFPHEVAETDIGTLFKSAVWNSGFMQQAPPDDTYAEGDVVIQIGYQHPPYRLLPKARSAGAKVAYVDVLQERDYPTGDNCLWIDPMWPWADGAVPIPNYDVPACPPSGVVNAAIAWEIYRLSRAAMTP